MSNSCFQTCTVVLIYCAILFARVDLSVSDKDSQLSRTRYGRSDDSFLIDRLYRNHPSLRHAVLTDNMRSLLVGLKRKKRISHHGRSNKIWKTPVSGSRYQEDSSRTTSEPPLININDIESPISREKHECKRFLTNDDIALDDFNREPISLVRRAVESLPTTRSSDATTLNKRQAEETTTPLEVPVIITEIVEVGSQPSPAPSKKLEQVAVQRRQAVNDNPTSCITVTDTTAVDTTTTSTVDTTTLPTDTTTVPTAPPPVETTIAPAAPADNVPATPAVAGPVGGPIQMVYATTQRGALKAQQPAAPVVTAVIPSQMSDTLSEILEEVEELADQKSTSSEDFPCHINGSWISEAGGVRLDIAEKGNNTLHIEIGEPLGQNKKKPKEGFLYNSTWNLTGIIPLSKKSMVIINGVNENENQVATFIGECKVCHHSETVAGHWLQVNTARDCNDQKDNFKILSDLWRRETHRSLKKQRLRNIGNGTQTTCVTINPTKS